MYFLFIGFPKAIPSTPSQSKSLVSPGATSVLSTTTVQSIHPAAAPEKPSVPKVQKQSTLPTPVPVTKPSAVPSKAVKTGEGKKTPAVTMAPTAKAAPTAAAAPKQAEPRTWAEQIAVPKVEPVEAKPLPVVTPKVEPPTPVKTPKPPTPPTPPAPAPAPQPIITPIVNEASKVPPQVKAEPPPPPPPLPVAVSAPAIMAAVASLETAAAVPSSPAKSTANSNGSREKPSSPPVKFTIGDENNSDTASQPGTPELMESLEKQNKPGMLNVLGRK